jgi:hypothetical protein
VTETTAPFGQSAVATIPQSSTATIPKKRASSGLNSLTDKIASTTTTTIPRSTTTTVPTPDAPAVELGNAAVQIGGVTQEMTVNRVDNKLMLDGGSVRATLEAVGRDGSSQGLDSEGNIRVREDGLVQFSAEGFAPDSQLEVWLFSTPTLLGRVQVPAGGNIRGKFPLPGGIPDGQHRIVLNGEAAGRKPVTMAIGIVVDREANANNVRRVLIGIPLGLAVLFGLILPPLKRRKKEDEELPQPA